jgi:DNA-binding winged helix-turn-helix (wHTH) protein
LAAGEKHESSLFRSPIRFDLFELDVKSGQLRRSGLPVDLSPQALKILVMLAGRPDELVTRKEIKEALWPGQSYGDFDSRLNFAVKKLRETLGDDAEQPRYVQTVRNAGYRFIAPVREPKPFSSASRDPIDHSSPRQGGALPESWQGTSVARGFRVGGNEFFLALGMVVVVAVAGTAVFMLRQHVPSQPTVSEVQAPAIRAEAGPEISSVTSILPQPRQRIVIKGRDFGLHVPYAHTDSPDLAVRDKTAHWAAGRMIPQNWDQVMLDVEGWTDTEIVVSGFSGDYGLEGLRLTPGDKLEIAVWNPQSGVGPALYLVTVISARTRQ